MDFIERLFGISPDGGSGTLEFVVFAVPVIIVSYLLIRRRSRQQLRC